MKCLVKNAAIFIVLWLCAFMTMDPETLQPTSWVYWLVAATFVLWVISVFVELIRDIQALIRSILE